MLNRSEADARRDQTLPIIEALYGPDWHTKIDTATLDVSDDRRCPLAQIDEAGSWTEAAGRLAREGIFDKDLPGLYVVGRLNSGRVKSAYQKLTESWIDLVNEKRATLAA